MKKHNIVLYKKAKQTLALHLWQPFYPTFKADRHSKGMILVLVLIPISTAAFCFAPQIALIITPTISDKLIPICTSGYRLIFLASVAVISWLLGTKRGLLVYALTAPIILVKAVTNFQVPNFGIDITAMGIGILFGVIAGRQGEMQKMLKEEIAEHTRYEEILRLKNALLEAQSEATNDGILVVNEKHKIVSCNRRFQEMWRVPVRLVETGLHEFLVRHMTSQIKDSELSRKLVECFSGDTTENICGKTQLRDGKVFSIFTRPIVDTIGINHGQIWYFRDVTEQEEMQRQMIMADRLASIGEMVSGIAHELNNPLTGVIGYSQLIMEKNIDNSLRDDLEIISNEALRATHIVKDLLTFARKHTPEKRLCQINSIIEVVLRLQAYEQKLSNIEVVTHLTGDLPEIMADYTQMQQVFLNIIINAQFFMVQAHNRGRLTITTEKTGRMVRCTFADDGPGIPQENLRRIFDPFFTTKEGDKGTGLGLSICNNIVKEHGGRIYAMSKPDEGATFVVELKVDSDNQQFTGSFSPLLSETYVNPLVSTARQLPPGNELENDWQLLSQENSHKL